MQHDPCHFPLRKRNFVVGRRYRVPCVYDQTCFRWWPVMGRQHVDEAEITRNPYFLNRYHWHVDLAFFTTFELKLFEVQAGHECGQFALKASETVCENKDFRFKYRWERRVCLRNWCFSSDSFPEILLEDKFCDHKLDLKKKICPHQGMQLTSRYLTVVDDKKCYRCPLHGLLWQASNGNLVREHS